MKFSLNQEYLSKAVDLVARIAPAKPMPAQPSILQNVRLVLTQTHLLLTASDFDVELTAQVKLPQGACISEGATTVNAAKFYGICKSLPKGDVLVQALDNERCLIQAGSSEFILPTMNANDFPSIGLVDKEQSLVLAREKLLDMITSTRFTVATNDVRHYLTGVLFHIKNNTLICVATDGFRLALAQNSLNGQYEDQQIIVPGKAVGELERLFGELSKIVGTDGDVALMMDSEFLQLSLNFGDKQEDGGASDTIIVSMTARLIEGRFPDYNRVIPTQNDKRAIFYKDDLLKVLRRASIISDNGVIFEFGSEDSVIVRAGGVNTESGNNKSVESLSTKYTGAALELSLNVHLLRSVLTALSGEQVVIDMNEPTSPTLITALGDDAHRYVVMPMRV